MQNLSFTKDLDTDLPFKKGETLWVIRKSDDEMWWTAKNSVGQEGQIPANYVEPYTDELATDYLSGDRHSSNDNRHPPSSNNAALQRKLPAFARVKQERVPNAYDKSALRLKVRRKKYKVPWSLNFNDSSFNERDSGSS